MPVVLLRILATGEETLRNSEVKIVLGAWATHSRRALGQGVADRETGEITAPAAKAQPPPGARAGALAVSREPHRIDWR